MRMDRLEEAEADFQASVDLNTTVQAIVWLSRCISIPTSCLVYALV